MIYFQGIKSSKEHILFEVAKSQNDGSESGDSQRFVAISEHIPPSWVTKGSHFNPETGKRSKGFFTLSTLLQTPPLESTYCLALTPPLHAHILFSLTTDPNDITFLQCLNYSRKIRYIKQSLISAFLFDFRN